MNESPFDVWFSRILVNLALDRVKARARQHRWIAQSMEEDGGRAVEQIAGGEASTERRLLAKERRQEVTRAVAALPDRQRLVFTLCHVDEQTPAEISAATGMSPATVRVHLSGVTKTPECAEGSAMSRRTTGDQDLNGALEAFRVAANAEADAHFDERALEVQRHRILDRLAHIGHSARVIRFPVAPQSVRPTAVVSRRWISVSAAAGLLLGVLSGQFVHFFPRSTNRPVASFGASHHNQQSLSGASVCSASRQRAQTMGCLGRLKWRCASAARPNYRCSTS